MEEMYKRYDVFAMTDEERKIFAETVESSEDFEKYYFRDYADAEGLSYRKSLMWGFRHEHGTDEQRLWIENYFHDENFHNAAASLEDRDYERFCEDVDRFENEGFDKNVEIKLPANAVLRTGKDFDFFDMPESRDGIFCVPAKNVEYLKGFNGDIFNATIKLPRDEKITVKNSDKPSYNVPAFVLDRELRGKTENDFTDSNTVTVILPLAANLPVIDEGARTLFKMPETGKYKDFRYKIPNRYVSIKPNDADEGKTWDVVLRLPKDFRINVSSLKNGNFTSLSLNEYLGEIKNKTKEDYIEHINYIKYSKLSKNDKGKD